MSPDRREEAQFQLLGAAFSYGVISTKTLREGLPAGGATLDGVMCMVREQPEQISWARLEGFLQLATLCEQELAKLPDLV